MKNNMLHIPIILGTAREGRQSEKVSNYLLEQAKLRKDFTTELIDVKDYLIPVTDNTISSTKAKKLQKIVLNSDGFAVVSPEYNHSYPGELKMMMDMLYYDWAKRAISFVGVSGGGWGGTRVVEQLRHYTANFSMANTGEPLFFPGVTKAFNEDGSIIDAEATGERITKFFDDLVWWSEALKAAREK